jgi:transmembrane sensor
MSLQNEPDRSGLEQEALHWLSRLTSGAATEADRAAFMRWRAQRPEHEEAFQDALRVWKGVGLAAQQDAALPRNLAPSSNRRQFLKMGALAAAVGGISVGGAKLGFWPGLNGMMADYATAAGEQKRVALGDHVQVELNTRSALSVDGRNAAHGLTLSGGEAVFTVRAGLETFTVSAGAGVAALERGVVAIRHDGDQVRITCLEGAVDIVQPGRARLKPSEQVICSGRHLGAVRTVDAEAVTGWRRGELVFRDEPLENVVSELNRYRKGIVVIASRAVAERRVTGLFHLDRLDEALSHIQQALRIPVRQLSPYFVMLG